MALRWQMMRPELPKNWYSTTDLWTDFGIRFIDDARSAKNPSSSYPAHNAPHSSAVASACATKCAKFRGKYKMGWDKLREQRNARQKESGRS